MMVTFYHNNDFFITFLQAIKHKEDNNVMLLSHSLCALSISDPMILQFQTPLFLSHFHFRGQLIQQG